MMPIVILWNRCYEWDWTMLNRRNSKAGWDSSYGLQEYASRRSYPLQFD